MSPNIGPGACPGEHAYDVISIVILQNKWSLSFKAEILVTAVTNCSLCYNTCRKSLTTNNLGVPVKLFWYQSLSMYLERITICIWNTKTRGLDWKINWKTSNLDTNITDTCNKKGSTSGARSIQRHTLPRPGFDWMTLTKLTKNERRHIFVTKRHISGSMWHCQVSGKINLALPKTWRFPEPDSNEMISWHHHIILWVRLRIKLGFET